MARRRAKTAEGKATTAAHHLREGKKRVSDEGERTEKKTRMAPSSKKRKSVVELDRATPTMQSVREIEA